MNKQPGSARSRDAFDGRFGSDLQLIRGILLERFSHQSTMGAL